MGWHIQATQLAFGIARSVGRLCASSTKFADAARQLVPIERDSLGRRTNRRGCVPPQENVAETAENEEVGEPPSTETIRVPKRARR